MILVPFLMMGDKKLKHDLLRYAMTPSVKNSTQPIVMKIAWLGKRKTFFCFFLGGGRSGRGRYRFKYTEKGKVKEVVALQGMHLEGRRRFSTLFSGI